MTDRELYERADAMLQLKKFPGSLIFETRNQYAGEPEFDRLQQDVLGGGAGFQIDIAGAALPIRRLVGESA